MSYLLFGQNGLLIDERVAALRAELDPANLSTSSIDVQTSTVSEIASTCQAMPFFGGHRVVILRNPIQIPKRGDVADTDVPEEDTGGRVKWGDLHDVLKATPPTTDVIMRHDGKLSETHYLNKAVRALSWRTESFAAIVGADLLAWIQQRVARQNIRISTETVRRLVELLYPTSWTGGQYANESPDMRLIVSEVDKLCCAAIDGVITEQIVDEMVADRSGYTAFKLNEHLFAGRPEAALQELERVLAAGEPAEKVLGQIASETVALAAVKRSVGMPRDALLTASAISPNRLGRLANTASGISDMTMHSIAESVRHADAAVKEGFAHGASATIITLVADVANVIRRGREAGRGRS